MLCSAYTPEEARVSLTNVDDFLAKPFSGDVLIERIQAVLSRSPKGTDASAGVQ